MSKKATDGKPPSPWAAVLNLLPLLVLTWYFCQSRPEADPAQFLDACGQNLHKIGVEVEKNRLLSEDKLYPPELEKVFKEGEFPECPVGGKDSYIDGFTLLDGRAGYLLVCKGKHHVDAGVPPDYPRIAFSVEEASANNSASEESKEKEEPDAGQEPKVSGSPIQGEVEGEDLEKEQEKLAEEKRVIQESPSPAATVRPE